MDLGFFLSAKTYWENVVKERWLNCFSVLWEMYQRKMEKIPIKMPFFPCSVFGKVCRRKMRNCSILARQVLTIEVTGVRENWVGKAITLCLSFCLKGGLTHLAVPLKDPFLNSSCKIFMSGASRSLMHRNVQFFPNFYLWLNIKNILEFSLLQSKLIPSCPDHHRWTWNFFSAVTFCLQSTECFPSPFSKPNSSCFTLF